MGGAQSSELDAEEYDAEELDAEAARCIQEQTREDLMKLQDPEYCNETLRAVAKRLGAVKWPAEFSFKGRIFNPNERSFALMARYYVQVAQMFAAGVRASLPPQAALAPFEPLAHYSAVLQAVAEARESPGIDPLALAGTYGARLAQHRRLLEEHPICVEFPPMGEMPRTMLHIKEEIEKIKALAFEINTEIEHRAEVLEARLRFDLLSQQIDFLENL